ncbi:MAG: hypothetical protein R2881_10025 [Eubacteriales bacterium]
MIPAWSGLTCVRQMIRLLPGEDIVYFGDTGRVPYGRRSVETIVRYARQDVAFLRSFDLRRSSSPHRNRVYNSVGRAKKGE